MGLILIGFAGILGRVLMMSIYEGQSWFMINLNFIVLISPALFAYSSISSDGTKAHLPSTFLHFLPFVIVNVGFICFYLVYRNSPHYQTYLLNSIKGTEAFSVIYFLVYLYSSHKAIQQNRHNYSSTQRKLVNQLIYTFLIFFVIWLAYIVAEWVYFHYSMELVFYYPMMLLLAVILYFMSMQILLNYQTLVEIKEVAKRKNFILKEEESIQVLQRLTTLMSSQKPYLDAELSLDSLAESLQVSPKTLSFVMNEHLHKKFNDYINEWRIEEIKKRLEDEAYAHIKMLNIALDCGFNSKSTFNLAFKKATGTSPSEYRRR